MKTKSPAFPLLAIALLLTLLLGLALYTVKLLAPIAQKLAVALLETLKTYLRAFTGTIEAIVYYYYPQGTENVLDVLMGMIVFDVCIAIAYVCKWGCRICE